MSEWKCLCPTCGTKIKIQVIQKPREKIMLPSGVEKLRKKVRETHYAGVLSYSEMSRKTGVSVATVCRFAAGTRPSIETYRRLFDYFYR